jgi:putative phosphoesterase
VRLAVFGDIHGDVRALEAVLRDAGLRGAEGAVHLGDLVGDGGASEAVVARIRGEGLLGVMGDWDLRASSGPPALSAPGALGEESRAFLRSLPAHLTVVEGETRFLFAHASPENPEEPALAEASEERLRGLFDRCNADVLVVGHTHRATARRVGERLILNPGSVARPEDGDPRPSYLILDTDAGVQVLRIRVELDVERPASGSVIS